MKPLRRLPVADLVRADEPVHPRGLGAAWTRLQRALRHAVAGARSDPRRNGSEHGEVGIESRGDAGLVVLSLSGGVLHASASARSLLGRHSASLCAKLQEHAFGECCTGALVGADGGALEVHAVQGTWGGGPAWVGMLSRVPPSARPRVELELKLELAAAREANAGLERLACVDALTSLLNRRGLQAALAREIGRRRRSGEPLTAVLIDCDDFKRVNDSRGHAVGDQVLRQVAHRLQETLRPSDHLGRIGGDEFLVLLPDTGGSEALRVAQRLRMAVGDRPVREPGGGVGQTVSLGLALLTDSDGELEDVLARTGASLKRSKRRGKNRLSGAGADAAPGGGLLAELRVDPSSHEPVDVLRVPLVRV
ncbi:MAG TPA: GGDEF domain-containing protein, partial [Planctomycetota bacterium]|nr:GGDEF domain-containing protein [Planctomycetota bacterium]